MSASSIHEFTVKNSAGQDYNLAQYKGKVVLIVNVASKCGYTPQYDGLEEVYKKYSDKGLVIIGFPCNQFGGQEPGSNQEIQEFCRLNHGVTFPILAKVEVNGDQAAPIYQYMKAAAPGLLGTEMIKWNFTKFLVGKDGKVIDRFAPATTPKDIESAIEKALGA